MLTLATVIRTTGGSGSVRAIHVTRTAMKARLVTPKLMANEPRNAPSSRSNLSPHRGHRSGSVNHRRNKLPFPHHGHRFVSPRRRRVGILGMAGVIVHEPYPVAGSPCPYGRAWAHRAPLRQFPTEERGVRGSRLGYARAGGVAVGQ